MTTEWPVTVTPADGRWHEYEGYWEDGSIVRYRTAARATIRMGDGTETVGAVTFIFLRDSQV